MAFDQFRGLYRTVVPRFSDSSPLVDDFSAGVALFLETNSGKPSHVYRLVRERIQDARTPWRQESWNSADHLAFHVIWAPGGSDHDLINPAEDIFRYGAGMTLNHALSMAAITFATGRALVTTASPLLALISGSSAVVGLAWIIARDHRKKLHRGVDQKPLCRTRPRDASIPLYARAASTPFRTIR